MARVMNRRLQKLELDVSRESYAIRTNRFDSEDREGLIETTSP